jgi:phosphate transport system permease protein
MRRRNEGLRQKLGFGVLLLATLIVVVPVLAIVGLIIAKGWGALSWSFLFTMPRDGMRAGGIWPAIVGTFYLVFVSIGFALPIGVAAAIYLSEYAKDNALTRTINLAIINLAGVSSVVYGLFGLSLFVVFLRFGVSIIAGALTLGIMTLPVIITTTREALRSVPRTYR